MPKKFVGENSKATAARARKQAAKDSDTSKRQKELEEQYWKDDDKHIIKKQQKKEELERKKQQQLEKKAESKALYEQEMKSLQSSGSAGSSSKPPAKITRAQIQAEAEKKNATPQAASKKSEITHVQQPLEENINRIMVEGSEARTIDEAIAVLSMKDEDVDRHPEKRMKAAFAAFEEANLPRIKAENSNLRLSQQKQILRKEWMKSPENPLNQRLSANK